MGTRLRRMKQKLSKKLLSDSKTIKGNLLDSTINQLSEYNGQAIRNNENNLDGIKEAEWATFFHKISTGDKPIHILCSGEWCKYKKAEAAGTLDTFTHKNSIPEAVKLAIKPDYRDLANPDLLKKCLTGKTQNVNESFNNVVWTRVPKNVFVGSQTLKLGVHDAVITFNDGNTGRLKVLEKLGVKIGWNTRTILEELDKERVDKAELRAQKSVQGREGKGCTWTMQMMMMTTVLEGFSCFFHSK